MAAATESRGGTQGRSDVVEGSPCWADVMLPDREAGKRFYGELLGWTFGPPADAGYGPHTEAFLHGKRVAALQGKRDGRLPTVWTVYFATADAVAATERIRAAGGQPVLAPTPVDGRGVLATAADPGGAVFGLWQPGTHGGFETRGEAGAFVWTEVHTREKEAVDSFYGAVFGYGMRTVSTRQDGHGEAVGTGPGAGAGSGADFLIWTLPGDPVDPEHAIGGRAVIGPGRPVELPAHFLVCFAVQDCDDAVRSATRLGGRTRHGPQTTPFGRIAGLTDNQGADFAVIDAETTDQTPG